MEIDHLTNQAEKLWAYAKQQEVSTSSERFERIFKQRAKLYTGDSNEIEQMWHIALRRAS